MAMGLISSHKGAFWNVLVLCYRGGPSGIYHHNVPVGSALPWSILSAAHMETSYQYSTMTSQAIKVPFGMG